MEIKKPPLRPNVICALCVFTVVLLITGILEVRNPNSVDATNILLTALAVLGTLFANLLNSDKEKD